MINEIYPIWSNVISFFSESEKSKLITLDSFTNEIILNSFNLDEVFGRWRYANKKLSYLSKDVCHFDSSLENALSCNRFVANWGVNCQIVSVNKNCYLKVVSVLGNKHHYKLNCSTEITDTYFSWIHSSDTFNIAQHELSNKLVYHFFEETVSFYIHDKFNIDIEIWDHKENKVSEIQDTNYDFINCRTCKTLKGVVKKIDNREFFNKLVECRNKFRHSIQYSMWNGNLLATAHDFIKRCYYFLTLISNSVTEKLIFYPEHDGRFFSGLYSLNYGGFICMRQSYHDQRFFQLLDVQTGQKFDLIKTEYGYLNSHFFRDLNLAFAFNEQAMISHSFNKISLLTQSNFTIELNFTKEIQQIVVCSQSHSLLVSISCHLVYTVNLIPLLKSKQNMEININ